MSVLVPLSMFATDPDAFRAQFLEERGKRFVRLEDAITKGKSPARTPLSKWRVTRILPASVQAELGRWQEATTLSVNDKALHGRIRRALLWTSRRAYWRATRP